MFQEIYVTHNNIEEIVLSLMNWFFLIKIDFWFI
jgi:hypothetical protein